MGHAKGLKDDEKSIIIEETAKRSSSGIIATILDLHIKTVQRFLKNPSHRKQRSDKGKIRF